MKQKINRKNIWKRVSLFGSSRIKEGTPEWQEARRFGRALAENNLTIVSGDPTGIGKAVSDEIKESNKGRMIFACTTRGIELGYGRYERGRYRTIPVAEWGEKRQILLDYSGYYLVLPGKLGTLSELVHAIDKVDQSIRIGARPSLVIIVGSYWKKTFEDMIKPFISDARVGDYVSFVESLDETLEKIRAYREGGKYGVIA